MGNTFSRPLRRTNRFRRNRSPFRSISLSSLARRRQISASYTMSRFRLPTTRHVAKALFKPHMNVKFQYDDASETLHNAGDANKTNEYYVANSAYNPAHGAGGELQPRYYDSFLGANNTAAPYFQYTVEGAYAKVTFINTTTIDVYIGIGFRDSNTTSPTTFSEVRERPFYKSGVLRSVTAGASNTKTLSMSMPVSKLYGIKKSAVIDETAYGANYNGDPSLLMYFDVWMIPVNPNNATSFDIYYDAKLSLNTRLHFLNDVADSTV